MSERTQLKAQREDLKQQLSEAQQERDGLKIAHDSLYTLWVQRGVMLRQANDVNANLEVQVTQQAATIGQLEKALQDINKRCMGMEDPTQASCLIEEFCRRALANVHSGEKP